MPNNHNPDPASPLPNHSVARSRIARAEKSRSYFGVFIVLIVVAALAGGAWYWVAVMQPERVGAEYDSETERLSLALAEQLGVMNQWSTEEVFDKVSNDLGALSNRERVSETAVDRMAKRLEGIRSERADRLSRFAGLLERAKGFPLGSGKAEVEAFDQEVLAAAGLFERDLSGELRKEWSIRRREIATDRLESSGTLLIRSNPTGAKVYIDGAYVAESPFSANRVAKGRHEAVIRKDGYHEKRLRFEMDTSGVVDLGLVDLLPISGGLKIVVNGGSPKDEIRVEVMLAGKESDDGAMVVLEGFRSLEGRSHDLDDLKIGHYSVEIFRNGASAAKRKVEVLEGKAVELGVGL